MHTKYGPLKFCLYSPQWFTRSLNKRRSCISAAPKTGRLIDHLRYKKKSLRVHLLVILLHKETVRVKKLSFYGNTLVEVLLLFLFFFFLEKRGSFRLKPGLFTVFFHSFFFKYLVLPWKRSFIIFFILLYLLYLVLYTQVINSIICKYVIQPSGCKVLVIKLLWRKVFPLWNEFKAQRELGAWLTIKLGKTRLKWQLACGEEPSLLSRSGIRPLTGTAVDKTD